MSEQERVLMAQAMAGAFQIVQRDPELKEALTREEVPSSLVAAITGLSAEVVEAAMQNLKDDGAVE